MNRLCSLKLGKSPVEGKQSVRAKVIMGIVFSKVFASLFGGKEVRILGLDNAGKTTILCECHPMNGVLLLVRQSRLTGSARLFPFLQIDCRPMRLNRRYQRSASIWKHCSIKTSSFKSGTWVAKRAFVRTGDATTRTRMPSSTSSIRPTLIVSTSRVKSCTQCLRCVHGRSETCRKVVLFRN